MKKNTPLPTGIDLLFDICKNPRKYDHFVNVPCWIDAASALIEMGYQLSIEHRPLILRRELYPSREKLISIASQFNREANLN